jgi:hypothetical protein
MTANVYRTRFEVRQMPDTLVIHCSDPRYQAHFQEFLHEHLGLESYELIAIPGGAQCLTLAEYLPKFSWAGWRWVKFLMDVAKPVRVVLIAHEGCRWYADNRFAGVGPGDRDHTIRDLQRVSGEVVERFGRIRVDSFAARLEDGHVVFDKV